MGNISLSIVNKRREAAPSVSGRESGDFLGDGAVEGELSSAGDHQDGGDDNDQDGVFNALPFLISKPIHKEAILGLDRDGRDEEGHSDAEGGDAGE